MGGESEMFRRGMLGIIVASVCFPAFGYKWSSLKSKGPVAVVTFCLDRSVVRQGSEESRGPGLMPENHVPKSRMK
jgi:hypothetical protein